MRSTRGLILSTTFSYASGFGRQSYREYPPRWKNSFLKCVMKRPKLLPKSKIYTCPKRSSNPFGRGVPVRIHRLLKHGRNGFKDLNLLLCEFLNFVLSSTTRRSRCSSLCLPISLLNSHGNPSGLIRYISLGSAKLYALSAPCTIVYDKSLKSSHFSISSGHVTIIGRRGATIRAALIRPFSLRIFIVARTVDVLPSPGSRNNPPDA